jgi:hypothetical protein
MTLMMLVIMSSVGFVEAQECGPSCPVCSGSGENTGALLASRSLLTSGLYIPGGEEETGVLNVRYGLSRWVDLGVGYTVDAKRPIWSIRLQPISEEEGGWRPGLILGTGSVQTGESDQSVFVQATKAHEFAEWLAFRASAGISADFGKVYGLTGLRMSIIDRFSPFATYDGRNPHVGLSWLPNDWLVISGLLVEVQEPAISVGFRWSMSPGSAADDHQHAKKVIQTTSPGGGRL